MDRVTIREVAAMAGVAVSTVSAVFNDSNTPVASSTRTRVLAAAEVLGYQPHHAARALRGKDLAALVVIEDEISTGPYGGQLLAGVHDVCGEQGVPVVGLTTGGDARREREAFAFASAMRARAVVLASVAEATRSMPQGSRSERTVLLNGRSPDDDLPGVVPDNEGGSAAVLAELLAFGHRRIGLLSIVACEAAERRLGAARAAITQAWGPTVLADELLVRMANVEATAGGGYEGAMRMLALPEPPTAIACFNDRMAMGVYRAAAECGWSVPGDLSVVGFDNAEPVADSLEPGLTTAALPEREMGQLAAVLALGDPKAPGSAPIGTVALAGRVEVSCDPEQLTRVGSTIKIACPVVVRGSVGVPRVTDRRPSRAASR